MRCTSREHVQRIVNRLAARGCVVVVANPAHKRSALLQVTDRGRSLLAKGLSGEKQFLDSLLSHTIPSELESASRFLASVRRNIAENSTVGTVSASPESSFEHPGVEAS